MKQCGLLDPSYGSKYLAMTDEDKFPILVKSDEYPGAVREEILLGCSLLI